MNLESLRVLYFKDDVLHSEAPGSLRRCDEKLVRGVASVVKRRRSDGSLQPEILSFLGPGGYFVAALTFHQRVESKRAYGADDARAEGEAGLARRRLPRSRRLRATLRGELWAERKRAAQERCSRMEASHAAHNLAEMALLVKSLGRLKGETHPATLGAHEELLILELVAARWDAARGRLRILADAYGALAAKRRKDRALELQWAVSAFDLAQLLVEQDSLEGDAKRRAERRGRRGSGGSSDGEDGSASSSSTDDDARGPASPVSRLNSPAAPQLPPRVRPLVDHSTALAALAAAARADTLLRLEEATALLEQVLAIFQKRHGIEDSRTRVTMRLLASVLWEAAKIAGVTGGLNESRAPQARLRLLLTKSHRGAVRQRKRAEELYVALRKSSANPDVLSTTWVPKALCLLSRRQKPTFLRGALGVVLQTLTGRLEEESGTVVCTPEALLSRVLSLPEPTPGSYVRCRVGPSTTLFDVCRPAMALPAVSDACVHALFTLLAPQCIAQLMSCALRGKHIAVMSRDRSALSLAVAGLHALLRPICHDGQVVHLLPMYGIAEEEQKLWSSIIGSRVAMLVGVPIVPDDAPPTLLAEEEVEGEEGDAKRLLRALALESAIDANVAVVHLDSNAVDVPTAEFLPLPIVCKSRLLRKLRSVVPSAIEVQRGCPASEEREWNVTFGPGSVDVRFECRLTNCRFYQRGRVQSQQFLDEDMEKPAYLVAVAFNRESSARRWPLVRTGVRRLEQELGAVSKPGEVVLVHAGGYCVSTVQDCMEVIKGKRHEPVVGPITMRFRSAAAPPPRDAMKALAAELNATGAALLAEKVGDASFAEAAARKAALDAVQREIAATLEKSDGVRGAAATDSLCWVDDAVAACVEASASLLRHSRRAAEWPKDFAAQKAERLTAAMATPTAAAPPPPIAYTLNAARMVQAYARDERPFLAQVVKAQSFATFVKICAECVYDEGAARRRFGDDAVAAVLVCDAAAQHIALLSDSVCPVAMLGDEVAGSFTVPVGDSLNRRRFVMRQVAVSGEGEGGEGNGKEYDDDETAVEDTCWSDSGVPLVASRRRLLLLFAEPPSIDWSLRASAVKLVGNGGKAAARGRGGGVSKCSPNPTGNCVWGALGAHEVWRSEFV